MEPLSQSEELLIRELFENSISSEKVSVSKLETVAKLSGDVSTRKYYRLFCAGKNFVVCIDSPENLSKIDYNFLTTQEVLKESGVPVPEIFDVRIDRGYVLMEDLGDETLLTRNAAVPSLELEEKNYKEIIDILLKIHLVDKEKYSDHSISRTAFDEEKYLWETNFTNENLIKKYLGNNNTSLVKDIEHEFRPIFEKILKLPHVPVHRDFHSRNIMFFEKDFFVIDFQDARQGPIQYDIVSLLEDAYYRVQRGNRYSIQKYFYESATSAKIFTGSFDEFIYGYELVACQRIYKAIGTFCYILAERNDPRYIRYVHNCFERLKEIMFKHEDLTKLRNLLSTAYYDY
jgi:aminoglycoside/choline kinase family phosphotransferase